jgi:5'-3' exonuclease
MFPGYKQKRRDKLAELSPEEMAMEEDFYRQTNDLRAIHLPALGFRNIFHQSGYEADDIIADLAKRLRRDNKIIIVSTDRDLFQLLHKNVEIWNPTKRCLWSEKWFANEFQIPVNMWPTVKAIAGCDTDSIPGLPMIGEKTAAKYLSGGLKYDSPHYRKIENATELIERNLQLVKLPLPGLRERSLRPDEESNDKWAAFFAAHGFHSLRELIPGMPKFRHGEPAA